MKYRLITIPDSVQVTKIMGIVVAVPIVTYNHSLHQFYYQPIPMVVHVALPHNNYYTAQQRSLNQPMVTNTYRWSSSNDLAFDISNNIITAVERANR
jgi:hypothetical protein